MATDWYKQTADQPAFPELLWSRPENRLYAGKLAIIGGDAHGFSAPAEAFTAALGAGIGTMRVVLPDAVKRLVPKEMQLDISFLPAVANGSFAKASLGELVSEAEWADICLLAGGVGRNSETAATLERFCATFRGKLVVTEDALDALLGATPSLFTRPDTVIVAALGQLQKLWPHASGVPVVSNQDGLGGFVEKMAGLSTASPAVTVTSHNGQLIVAQTGKVSTSPAGEEVWRVRTSAKAAVWWAWNPEQPFEAVTSSLIAR